MVGYLFNKRKTYLIGSYRTDLKNVVENVRAITQRSYGTSRLDLQI